MKKKGVEVFNDSLDQSIKKSLAQIVYNFDTYDGGIGERNIIKIIPLNNFNVNVKAFKVPNLFNQIAYRFFRKSKAQRSFEYANKLLKLGIGTPKPLAYFEYKSPFLFKKSFYLSEQLDCDITFRELTKDFDYPNYDAILRAFTRFTFDLHEKGIQFLDHSPGNTLIREKGNGYQFYLVDLNRMNFGALDFETRIKNFSRLTTHKSMVEVMSDEYAKCSGSDYNLIFNLMWKEIQAFQERYHGKIRLKKKLKFWK